MGVGDWKLSQRSFQAEHFRLKSCFQLLLFLHVCPHHLNWQEWFSLKIRIFVFKYLCFSVMTARQRQFTGAAGTLLTVPRSANKRTGPGNTRRHARGPWEGGTESEGGHTWSEGGHTLNQVLKLSQSVADSYCTEITIFCGDSFGYWGRWGICLKTWKVPTVLFLESHEKNLYKIETAPHIRALMFAPKRCIFGEVCLLRSYHELLWVHVLLIFLQKKVLKSPQFCWLLPIFTKSIDIKSNSKMARDF